MRFLADMGISRTAVKWLNENDHDAVHLRDVNLKQASDTFILDKAKNENRIIITCDLDFGQLMALSNNKFPSVILLRLKNEKAPNQIAKIQHVITEAALSLLNGAMISVNENDFRVRITPFNK